MIIGKAIKKRRAAVGMSQAELADRAGVTQATISIIESGKRANPSWDTIVGIARALGCKIEDLYSEEGGGRNESDIG